MQAATSAAAAEIGAGMYIQNVGCVVYKSQTGTQVLLVSKRKNRDAWCLPAGGWEANETQTAGAQRETWEEAGVECRVLDALGTWAREPGAVADKPAKKYTFYRAVLESAHERWPECAERARKWVDLAHAIELVADDIMKKALERAQATPLIAGAAGEGRGTV